MPPLFKKMNRARGLMKRFDRVRKRVAYFGYVRKARREITRLPFRVREADIKHITIICAQMHFPLERLPELAAMMRNQIAASGKHGASAMSAQMFIQELQRLSASARSAGIPRQQLGAMLRQQRAMPDIVGEVYGAGQE